MPLAGGFKLKQKVYYVNSGSSNVSYGAVGTVVGYGSKSNPVCVRFSAGEFVCKVMNLSVSPPPLPGGFQYEQKVYYMRKASSKVSHGALGTVVGHGSKSHPVCVRFPAGEFLCEVVDLSPNPPPLPGGFKLMQKVYYMSKGTGKVSYGAVGTVVGHGSSESNIQVSFARQYMFDVVNCLIKNLSLSVPPLAGGFSFGQIVYFKLKGKNVRYGLPGTVEGYGSTGSTLRVKFGNESYVCTEHDVSSCVLPLPGNFTVGQLVYYLRSDNEFVSRGIAGFVLGYGVETAPIEVRFPNSLQMMCQVESLSEQRELAQSTVSSQDIGSRAVLSSPSRVTPSWPLDQLSGGYSLINDVRRCSAAVRVLSREQEIAVDIEGFNLCRIGRVSLIQIHSAAGHTYLFDIVVLGEDAFTAGGLAGLFANESVCKVIFDGRADNDALYHIYGIHMRPTYCLQILHSLKFSTDGDSFVKGFVKCLDESGVLPAAQMKEQRQLKEAVRRLLESECGRSCDTGGQWEHRPLSPDLLEYAVADVKYMLEMKKRWSSESLDVLVEKYAEERIMKAVHAEQPARGKDMARRDFPLTGGEHSHITCECDYNGSDFSLIAYEGDHIGCDFSLST